MAEMAGKMRHIGLAMDLLNQNLFNQHFLWASCIWGAIASGYMVFGWRQKTMIPFLGGLVMTAASFLIMSALLMSLASLAIIFAVWWLLRQGY
jgi:hypothetical protein